MPSLLLGKEPSQEEDKRECQDQQTLEEYIHEQAVRVDPRPYRKKEQGRGKDLGHSRPFVGDGIEPERRSARDYGHER